MVNETEQQGSGEPYRRTVQDLPPGDSPTGGRSGYGGMIDDAGETDNDQEAEESLQSDEALIQTAQTIYQTSTDYLDSNVTNTWETSLSHFNGQHSSGTKFNNSSYKRSRVFRPKTRSMTKSSEAALTNAMFSTLDVLDVQPEDATDQIQVASAAINKQILQLRLDRKIKWFQTAIGAYQSTKVYGLCISMQRWDYHADTDVVPATNADGSFVTNEDGDLMGFETTRTQG